MAAPYTPSSDDKVILQLLPLGDVDQRFQQLRLEWKKNPLEASVAAELATLYLDRAQDRAGERYLGYAQAVLAPWSNSKTASLDIRYLSARLLQAQHQFVAAIHMLNSILKINPAHISARFSLASLYEARGEYQQGQQVCKQLGRNGEMVLAALCVANFWTLTNKSERGLRLLISLMYQVEDPILKSWVLGIMAQASFVAGQIKQADHYYQQGLALTPKQAYLLTAYADFLLAQNRGKEVLILLSGKIRDARLLLRVALAHKMLRNNRALEVVLQRLRLGFEEAKWRVDNSGALVESRYLFEFEQEFARALELAYEHWQVEKSPYVARLILNLSAEVGKNKASVAVRRWLIQEQIQRKDLWLSFNGAEAINL
ncbi:MAG: hypothetical protein Q9N68_12985 [Gammaproteobacteria bacterium]|nr:hypothetical protein [Gammaproteobacteria bacterium]